MNMMTILGLAALVLGGQPLPLSLYPPAMAEIGGIVEAAGHQTTGFIHVAMAMRAVQDHIAAGGAREDVVAYLDKFIETPEFADAPAFAQAEIYELLGTNELLEGDSEQALSDILRSGEIFPWGTDANYWSLVLTTTARIDGQGEAFADAATHLAQEYPNKLRSFGDEGVLAITREVLQLPRDNSQVVAYLEAFRALDYKTTTGREFGEYPWRRLVEGYVFAGENAKAAAVAATFKEPESIVWLTIDKRYEAFAPQDPVAAYAAASDAIIEVWRKKFSERPRDIGVLNSLAIKLDNAGRSDEALALVNTALSQIENAPADNPPFDELEDEEAWLWDMATRPLFKLGKTEEALALLEKADQSPGSDVVSHRLNLAMAYTILGRPQDAMDRLDDWSEKDGSKFGNIFAQDIRACASAQLGATAVVEEALSYVEAHVPEGPDTVVEALSCVGDLERLKKAILAGLDNPSTRNDFLRILQDYREPPHVTAKEREIADNLQSMRDDRDIISAVAKYGTIRSWPAYTALF